MKNYYRDTGKARFLTQFGVGEKKVIRNRSNGFTLVELLIVLLIIGVLSGVTLRAIDMTRERTMYSETAQKLSLLAKAIAGDPELISDGKRIDFGFVGDMGRLPLNLDELIKNLTNSPDWNGPYLKVAFLEDTVNPSFKRDAWGNEIEYSAETGLLRSRGNGRQPMTYKVADSVGLLLKNKVSGIITDAKNNPPGNYYNFIQISLELPNAAPPLPPRNPNKSGFYQFDSVPIGKHRIKAIRMTALAETLVKWVSVVPKSNTMIDFSFSRSFQSNLLYIEGSGEVLNNDPSSVKFEVFNAGGEAITLNWLRFINIKKDTNYYVYTGKITAQYAPYNPIFDDSTHRCGIGGTAHFQFPFDINASGREIFTLWNFRSDSTAPGAPPVPMDSVEFKILFSDGSVIGFTTPNLP